MMMIVAHIQNIYIFRNRNRITVKKKKARGVLGLRGVTAKGVYDNTQGCSADIYGCWQTMLGC